MFVFSDGLILIFSGPLKCRLKIFVPIAFLAFGVMVPVNWTNATLKKSNLVYSNLDELSISNVPLGSHRYATHCILSSIVSVFFILVVLFFSVCSECT